MSESPTGSTVPIVDSTGAQWTIIAGQAAKNGVAVKYTKNVALLLYWNHILYQQNNAGNWYQWVNNSFSATTDPRVVAPTESTQGATLASTTGTIYDAKLVAWTLVSSTGSGLQIAKNGVVDKTTSNVTLLLYYNHAVYQQNSAGGWWDWVNSTWLGTSDPRSVTPTESAQGTSLTSATGTIYDASLAKWTLVASASSGLQVAKDGVVDTTTSDVTLLLYWNHTVYQQNSGGNWWDWTNSAWNGASDPRVAPPPPNSNLAVNLGSPTGKTVLSSLFGFCGGGLCYGNNQNNDFDVVLDTQFQASAAKLKPGYIRLNTQQTEPLLQNVFANGVGNPNWAWLDNWINNHAGFFNDATSHLTFGIGPAFADTSISASTWASWAVAVANHLKAAGQECFYWEIGNEPDGMNNTDYCNYFNTIADALHGVNAAYLIGGPVTSYWGGGGLDQPFLSNCTSRIGYVVWHAYGFSGSATPSSSQVYQQALGYTNISSIRSEVSSHGLPNTVPLSIGEYNMLLDGGNNGIFDAAMFSCLFMTGCFQNDPCFTMGAVWDLVGPNGGFTCIGNSFVGGNSTIDPQGWYLGMAGQMMPGAEVSTSTTLGNMQLLASKTANTWALQIANYDTSGNSQTVIVGVTGGTVGAGINMWQLDNANPNGTTSALTNMAGVSCPGPSITILSGTYS